MWDEGEVVTKPLHEYYIEQKCRRTNRTMTGQLEEEEGRRLRKPSSWSKFGKDIGPPNDKTLIARKGGTRPEDYGVLV